MMMTIGGQWGGGGACLFLNITTEDVVDCFVVMQRETDGAFMPTYWPSEMNLQAPTTAPPTCS